MWRTADKRRKPAVKRLGWLNRATHGRLAESDGDKPPRMKAARMRAGLTGP